MTEKEFMRAINKIKSEQSEKIKAVRAQYAEDNNPVKIGDMISDHYQTLKVERFCIHSASFKREFPFYSYHGPLITKAGKPFKSGKRGRIYQTQLKIINGVSIEKEKK